MQKWHIWGQHVLIPYAIIHTITTGFFHKQKSFVFYDDFSFQFLSCLKELYRNIMRQKYKVQPSEKHISTIFEIFAFPISNSPQIWTLQILMRLIFLQPLSKQPLSKQIHKSVIIFHKYLFRIHYVHETMLNVYHTFAKQTEFLPSVSLQFGTKEIH